ncbi:hypothetical protein GUJ93_ZPchr0002g23814 [Zizania palustris]|uniref:Uncharacterized protein n=1 Tax=Zizania palustris TaxID=103762 RepID=A0A8J5ST11_ZIZPA|nr:hypothetical protein GUJ93_ZPchr0002g23814 [Zizania palustris]
MGITGMPLGDAMRSPHSLPRPDGPTPKSLSGESNPTGYRCSLPDLLLPVAVGASTAPSAYACIFRRRTSAASSLRRSPPPVSSGASPRLLVTLRIPPNPRGSNANREDRDLII